MLQIVDLNSADSLDGRTEEREQIECLSLVTAEQRTGQMEDQMTFASWTVEKVPADLLATKISVAQMAVKVHYSVFSVVGADFCREVDSVVVEIRLIDAVVENGLIVSAVEK